MGLSMLTVAAAVEGGGYVSIVKAVPVLLILLVWTRLLTWVDKDAVAAHLQRETLNASFMGGLVLAFAGFFILPGFILSFAVVLLVLGVEVGAYLMIRQKKVGLGDLHGQFNDWIASLTKKDQAVKEEPNQVVLTAKGGDKLPIPKKEDMLRPWFDAVQSVLSEGLQKGAQQIDFAPSSDGMAVKYYVDGFGYKGATVDRDNGSGAISMIKSATGLDIDQKRKPQRGNLRVWLNGNKIDLRVDSAGSTAGEYVRLASDFKTRHSLTLDQLGLTEKQSELLTKEIKDKTGIVLVSAPKGQGLTSMLYAILRAHDAFLEHIHSIERAPDVDLEGITQNKLAPTATPAEELKQTKWVISQEPDVVLMPTVESPETAQALITFAKSGKRAYVGLQASSNAEAIAMWQKLVGNNEEASSQLRLAINGRVIRKLCTACKVGYVPDAGTLRKLNMSPDAVKELYQARTEPIKDPKGNPVPCNFCLDLRFKGRVGVFETLMVDDEMRAVIAAGAQPAAVRAAFRKQRGKYLQEEALAIVQQGETSVQEVLRVMKPGEPSSAADPGGQPASAASPARAPSRPPSTRPATS